MIASGVLTITFQLQLSRTPLNAANTCRHRLVISSESLVAKSDVTTGNEGCSDATGWRIWRI